MTLRLAVVVSHPIQHFAPWHREIAKLGSIDLKVFFCCDWGVEAYFDPEFGAEFKWDTPLLDGYAHEFLRIKERPASLNYWTVDNPGVGAALERFDPHVVQVFGYAYRTNWRVAAWTKKNQVPLLLYSDSAFRSNAFWMTRIAKTTLVKRFYTYVDGALAVGDNNRRYHSGFGIPSDRLFPGSLPIDYDRLITSVPDRDRARTEIRKKFRIPQEAFLLLFCGKLSTRKRPLDLVLATRSISDNGRSVWALIVGEGPERSAIRETMAGSTSSRLALAGFINQSDVPLYYAASDVLVVPSEMDPHPLVVSEAASFGLPAIVSDQVGCIGPTDTAQPGINALKYPCRNVAALRQAIELLRDDAEIYSSMSLAASEIAKSQTAAVAAKQLVAAVRQLHHRGPIKNPMLATQHA